MAKFKFFTHIKSYFKFVAQIIYMILLDLQLLIGTEF